MPESCFLQVLFTWSWRRWVVAAVVGGATFLLLGLPTAVISNPVFGRTIAPTDWAMPVLAATSVLTGMLAATYVRNTGRAPLPAAVDVPDAERRSARGGAIGGALAYLAIGCPVCNKIALIALGSTGAIQFFAPVQPYLAAAGVLVLAWALIRRLRGELTCSFGTRSARVPGELPADLRDARDHIRID